ncbi:MAG: hypothetical protein ACOZAQ_10875 [Pseudomonadota bacterium]
MLDLTGRHTQNAKIKTQPFDFQRKIKTGENIANTSPVSMPRVPRKLAHPPSTHLSTGFGENSARMIKNLTHAIKTFNYLID